MCGIAGAIVYDPCQARLDSFLSVVDASQIRGKDSFGMLRWSPTSGITRFAVLDCKGRDWLAEIGAPATDEQTIYIHTSRAEPTTEWCRRKSSIDIPPFADEGVGVAHNGIIANDRELISRYGLQPVSEIDTAVLPPLIAKIGVWSAVANIQGGAALAIVDSRRKVLTLCRNFMPLIIAWQPGIVCFASEAGFFPDATKPFKSNQLWELPPYTGIELSAKGYRGPVNWGDEPIWESDDEGWLPFPALNWRERG